MKKLNVILNKGMVNLCNHEEAEKYNYIDTEIDILVNYQLPLLNLVAKEHNLLYIYIIPSVEMPNENILCRIQKTYDFFSVSKMSEYEEVMELLRNNLKSYFQRECLGQLEQLYVTIMNGNDILHPNIFNQIDGCESTAGSDKYLFSYTRYYNAIYLDREFKQFFESDQPNSYNPVTFKFEKACIDKGSISSILECVFAYFPYDMPDVAIDKQPTYVHRLGSYLVNHDATLKYLKTEEVIADSVFINQTNFKTVDNMYHNIFSNMNNNFCVGDYAHESEYEISKKYFVDYYREISTY